VADVFSLGMLWDKGNCTPVPTPTTIQSVSGKNALSARP